MSFSNKVALVTGASSGIGAAIAIKLTEEGARVAIVGRNEAKLNNVSDICEKRGVKPLTIIADISKDDDAKRMVNETINFFGKLDILVNNAGIGDSASILDDGAIDVFDKVIGTNLRAAILVTHLAIKYLIEAKGNIINISSVGSKLVLARNSFSYCSSKAALDHFTRSIALELAPKGVRVNAVNPGPVKTDMFGSNVPDKATADSVLKLLKNATALDRIADPEEVADLVAFLASDKAKSITGSTIVTDNGVYLKGPMDQHLYYDTK